MKKKKQKKENRRARKKTINGSTKRVFTANKTLSSAALTQARRARFYMGFLFSV